MPGCYNAVRSLIAIAAYFDPCFRVGLLQRVVTFNGTIFK